MTYGCYTPKPVTCEKWDRPLFYLADDMIQFVNNYNESVYVSYRFRKCIDRVFYYQEGFPLISHKIQRFCALHRFCDFEQLPLTYS